MKKSIIKAIKKVVPQCVRQSKITPIVIISGLMILFLILVFSTIGDTERWVSLSIFAN